MHRISRFVVWICKKFNRTQIEHIVNSLLDVLYNPNSEIQPKDQFKEDHPNYRNYYVDSQVPLTEAPEAPKTKKKRKKPKRSTTR